MTRSISSKFLAGASTWPDATAWPNFCAWLTNPTAVSVLNTAMQKPHAPFSLSPKWTGECADIRLEGTIVCRMQAPSSNASPRQDLVLAKHHDGHAGIDERTEDSRKWMNPLPSGLMSHD